jgi:hypothetical protein
MANSKRYDIERRTGSTDAVPSALQGDHYWYDTGTTENGEKVYYDNASKTYAYWNDGSDWLITIIADVATTPTDYFIDVAGTATGSGAWSGTITISALVLADAWYRAETTAFESLRNFTGCEENDDCFRGFLPVQGDSDDFKTANIWMMTSGSSGEFDSVRLTGDGALWCSLRSDARIESLWSSRSEAMKFAGLVEAWLRETNNLHETGNIAWCNMTDIPDEPEIYRTDGKIRKRYWQQTINLELVYQTETTFA